MTKLGYGILLLLLGLLPVSLKAGAWKIHTPFRHVDAMAETLGRVYFTSLGSLYAFDKANNEIFSLIKETGLNDVGVSAVFAPTGSRFAAACYESGNIDIIFDDGSIVNLPDIREASISSHRINFVSFNTTEKKMLVATSFGVVLFNLEKYEVTASLITGLNTEYAFYVGNDIFIVASRLVYRLSDGATFGKLENWATVGEGNFSSLLAGEGLAIALQHDGEAVALEYDTASRRLVSTPLGQEVAALATCVDASAPFVLVKSGTVVFLNDRLLPTATLQFPLGLETEPVTFTNSRGVFHSGSDSAITCYEEGDRGQPAPGQVIKPGNLSVGSIKMLRRSPSGNLYIGNKGNSNVFGVKTTAHKAFQCRLGTEGVFVDITPEGLSVTSPFNNNTTGVLFDPTFMREDPVDPSVFYTGNITEGFYAIDVTTGKERFHFHGGNTPMTDYWGVRAMDIAFDANGNLWLVTEREPELPAIMMLPASALRSGNDIQPSDWIVAENTGGFKTGRDAMAVTSSDGRFIYFMGEFDMLVYDTARTTSTADDYAIHAASFRLDNGGGYIEPSRLNKIILDKAHGSLWIATARGVLVAPDPENPSGGEMVVARPIVNRNDGSGLGDYLLATQCVYDIAIDGAGNKWLATDDSGVYVTNPSGTEILAHYTSRNSGLPANSIYAVDCDPAGNGLVYFGTDYGLVEFDSAITSGTSSYSSVRIFPNPIRPDFQGNIRIEGLIDGSRVKILDSGGSVIAELQSEGGTVLWEATTQSGLRVPAGVYHVIASSPAGEGGTIGKIVVIR